MVSLRLQIPNNLGRAFKADAKAEGMDICIGGFELTDGRITKESRWFAIALEIERFPRSLTYLQGD